MSRFPVPHFDKLNALLQNDKVPTADKPKIGGFIGRYKEWVAALEGVKSKGGDRLRDMVRLLNGYRDAVDIELKPPEEQTVLKQGYF